MWINSEVEEARPSVLLPAGSWVLMLPRVKVAAEPVRPDASCPRVRVERAKSKNAPLFRAPRRVKPKWLTEHSEDARPASPAFTLVLRKPDRDNAAKGNANLIHAQSPLRNRHQR